MLPLMISMLVILTIFFFAVSLVQLYKLNDQIQNCPRLELRQTMDIQEVTGEKFKEINRLDYLRWKTLVALEDNAIQRRYHQANVLLMSRIWIKYLGFVIGMILSILGAVFIIGKLREPETKLDSESLAGKFSIATTSPGLVLVVLGTILMLTTMITHNDIVVKDGPLFVDAWYAPVMQQTTAGPSAELTGTRADLMKLMEKMGQKIKEDKLQKQ